MSEGLIVIIFFGIIWTIIFFAEKLDPLYGIDLEETEKEQRKIDKEMLRR